MDRSPTLLLEEYFSKYRNHIVGIGQTFQSPYGRKEIVYADWTASGRIYRPIEERLQSLHPFVGNTHTETNVTGSGMTIAYHRAMQTIKAHVNAGPDDVLISRNAGMTGVVNKFQRILGLKVHEHFRHFIKIDRQDLPVVFVTHMEHHSNQTTWLETLAEVVVVDPCVKGMVDLKAFEEEVKKYQDRPLKIAAVTSCSNVTGLLTPYHEIAAIMHRHGGVCFVDFACSAPYIDIDMHPVDPMESLDAIYFSPHKFLGGPGTTGILVFNSALYKNEVPDHPGGGTVTYTNPWGKRSYVEDIEAREDGGTPPFLQTIKAAFCVQLKEEMGVENIMAREEELLEILWSGLEAIPNLHLMAGHLRERLGVLSFFIDGLHYNLGVKLLNDHFGIQVRGGCSCAGTYGHFLLHVDENRSLDILESIKQGSLNEKPGWIRLSIHPTMTNEEVHFLCDAVKELATNFEHWGKAYTYDCSTNSFTFIDQEMDRDINDRIEDWFSAPLS